MIIYYNVAGYTTSRVSMLYTCTCMVVTTNVNMMDCAVLSHCLVSSSVSSFSSMTIFLSQSVLLLSQQHFLLLLTLYILASVIWGQPTQHTLPTISLASTSRVYSMYRVLWYLYYTYIARVIMSLVSYIARVHCRGIMVLISYIARV